MKESSPFNYPTVVPVACPFFMPCRRVVARSVVAARAFAVKRVPDLFPEPSSALPFVASALGLLVLDPALAGRIALTRLRFGQWRST